MREKLSKGMSKLPYGKVEKGAIAAIEELAPAIVGVDEEGAVLDIAAPRPASLEVHSAIKPDRRRPLRATNARRTGENRLVGENLRSGESGQPSDHAHQSAPDKHERSVEHNTRRVWGGTWLSNA